MFIDGFRIIFLENSKTCDALENLHLCHRRRLLILAGGAETRNVKQLHTKFSKLSVIKAQFGSLINDALYPIH